MSSAGIVNGYLYNFTDGNDIITMKASAWTGTESIFFNDELISKKKKYGFSSRYKFARNDHNYEVNINVTSPFAGRVECLVLKDDHVIGREEKGLYSGGVTNFLIILLTSLCIGLVAGYGVGWMIEYFNL
ncbi:hypothetical protein [Paremcibacter congregatus]|uniref:Uncharacterized protein n=1 Tax=Paremcibacter congregatus TaxID=2043170 RepID=A0A2G4YWC2_9PROT|nr:hypothetical protein [Paremcibacter congregatus]PHZ85726.1 hypothetical protein CRD36_03320 [Paremcibacter congregatus]QDE26690.1 hypothetical protein FIV45_05085 [Paremcibacter congregatus]